ncbi:MAG: hypothetical protein WAO02_01750 [Verrucomicrobiia bacterium]
MAKIHKDARLQSRKEMPIQGVITYGGPLSRQFAGILPEGEILRLDYEPADSVQGIWLVPERYVECEKIFIPQEAQTERAYNGYAVYCPCEKIGQCFELLSGRS